jgi:hypothetical protein
VKFCKSCNRPKEKGHVCDVAELSDGRVVAAKRLDIGGDLREQIGDDLKVVNRWIKPKQLG